MRLGGGFGRAAAIAASACALALAACSSAPSSPLLGPPHRINHDNRPNIVFVLTDDLATNLMQYMPHVQALEQAGATSRNFFVVDSLCCPSRAAIFTGLYPHDDGVFTNGGPGGIRPDGGYHAYNQYGNPAKSFGIALQRAGYRTGFMGKYLNGYQVNDPPPPGWDEWDGSDTGYTGFNYTLNENGTVCHYGDQPQDYMTDVLSGKAGDFIKSSAWLGQPFALEVATFAPHRPSTPAPRDQGSFPTVRAPRGPAFDRQPTDAPPWLANLKPLSPTNTRRIDAEFRRRVEDVQAVDRMIGHLGATLAAMHQLKNTYFVFSSDNGYHMGEYRMRPGKQTAFDTDIRVPLVVVGPGVQPGSTINAMASSIDLAPTFQEIAGARPVATQDGVSLLDLLHGQPAPADWQRAILVEHHGPVTDPSDPDLQPPSAGDPPSYEAMRATTFLYAEYVTGEREYYNLTRDPYELHNLAGRLPAQQLARLHTELEALANCHGATQCQHAASTSGV
jgi:arylsulfatase A-like enzyme